jgi:hypothetical protein
MQRREALRSRSSGKECDVQCREALKGRSERKRERRAAAKRERADLGGRERAMCTAVKHRERSRDLFTPPEATLKITIFIIYTGCLLHTNTRQKQSSSTRL